MNDEQKAPSGAGSGQEAPVPRILNAEPLIRLYESFISPEECAELIRLATPLLQRARVSAAQKGVESQGRTGRNCWIPHHETPLVSGLSKRVSRLLGMPLRRAESLQVIHYGVGQEYAPHFDAWDADSERGQRCMQRGGQRLLTCLLYLNQVEEGGGTGFPKLGLSVAAKKGQMLVFDNCHPGTSLRHPHSLHGGLPVTRGEKWACNFWFRQADYWPLSS